MLSFFARMIVFMIAVSAIRWAVNSIQRLFSGAGPRPPVVRTARAQSPATVLQQDPVCGTYVAVDSSLKRIVSGRVIHFCSPECRARYVA